MKFSRKPKYNRISMAAERNLQEHHREILHRNRRATIGTIAIVIILALFVIGVFLPDRSFSPDENRNLQRFPKPTVSSIKSGDFFQDLNSYMTDQFAFRDTWLSLHYLALRATGAKESGGVLLGKDGYLLAKPDTPNQKALEKSEAAIREFADDHANMKVTMTLVPCAGAVMPDRLPKNAPVRDQLADIASVGKSFDGSKVTFVNPTKTLQKHASEYIYYKTDHHWTTQGAYYAYRQTAKAMGLPEDDGKYTKYLVSNSFKGTLSSLSGNHMVEDDMYVFVKEKPVVEYYVMYPDLNTTSTSVYNSEKLQAKDQYELFFGGNHPLVEIHTANRTGKTLLVFKDSYANSMVPFLLPYYDSIYMIDPRYYYDSLQAFLSTHDVSDVLFLYSQNTFATDKSLADVLATAKAEDPGKTAEKES